MVSDEIIDWKNSNIQNRAQLITAQAESDIEKAKLLFEWVRDEIPHSKDIDSDIVTCKASDVLHKSTGICYAKSHLLAALLRTVNIPAGFVYQKLKNDPPEEGFVLHGLNGVFLESLNKWILLDARGNTNGINAQFNTDQPQLAFPTNIEGGEILYKTIFAQPAKEVVDVLLNFSSCQSPNHQNTKSLNDLWPHLPKER